MRISKLITVAPIALLLVISAACAPAPTATQSPNPSASAPTATNTPNPAGLCANSLIPVKTGATWNYANDAGTSNAGTFSATITAVRPDGFTVATKFDDSSSIDQQWSCTSDGLVAESLGAGQNALSMSAAGINAKLNTATPTGITLPPNVQTGDKWPYALQLTGSVSQGNLNADLSGSISTDMQAVGTESVTVPAGTFDNAVKVQATTTIKAQAGFGAISIPINSVLNTTFWFAPGVGWVKSSTTGELVGTALSTTTELQSFNIP